MRIQQHKMLLPPLPTSTLAIVINWVQRMGQNLRHGEKVLQIVWLGGGKNRHGWGMVKKRCLARARRANTPPYANWWQWLGNRLRLNPVVVSCSPSTVSLCHPLRATLRRQVAGVGEFCCPAVLLLPSVRNTCPSPVTWIGQAAGGGDRLE